MKKILTLILAVVLTAAAYLPVSADDEISVYINGGLAEFDAAPVIENSRTYVPISSVASLLGAQVEWYEESRGVEVKFGENRLLMFVDSCYMEYNGEPLSNDAVPFILNSRTMVPLRVISEYMGCGVWYDDNLKRVDITSYEPVRYSFYGNSIDVYGRYSEKYNICVRLEPTGTNGLFDFSKVYLIPNDQSYIKSDLSEGILLYQSSTDWHAPFVVNAAYNPLTTNRTSFTGGNHGYSGNEGGSQTASFKGVTVEADGIGVSQGMGSCSALRITWKNAVQGSNTKETSGFGREIMEEEHVLTFDGDSFWSDVSLTALEEIELDLAYGFAAETGYVWGDKIEYENPEYCVSYPGNVDSNAGDKDCLAIVCSKNGNVLKMSLDTSFGLGERKALAADTNSAFYRDYGKVYFTLVNLPLRLRTGQVVRYRGSYKFYSDVCQPAISSPRTIKADLANLASGASEYESE